MCYSLLAFVLLKLCNYLLCPTSLKPDKVKVYLLSAPQHLGQVLPHLGRAAQAHTPRVVDDARGRQQPGGQGQGRHDTCSGGKVNEWDLGIVL